MLETRSRHPDCVRIWKRLYKHCDELFTFLDDPAVPPDHNGTERDIRSLAAARSDGGTHRADWSAAAFARLKSVIVTGMKNRVDTGGEFPSAADEPGFGQDRVPRWALS